MASLGTVWYRRLVVDDESFDRQRTELAKPLASRLKILTIAKNAASDDLAGTMIIPQ